MYQVQQIYSKCLASLVPPRFLNRNLTPCSSQPWSPNSIQQQIPTPELQFPCLSAVYHCCLLKEGSQFHRHTFPVSHPLFSSSHLYSFYYFLPRKLFVPSLPLPAIKPASVGWVYSLDIQHHLQCEQQESWRKSPPTLLSILPTIWKLCPMPDLVRPTLCKQNALAKKHHFPLAFLLHFSSNELLLSLCLPHALVP